jgi:hypothetical protein
MMHAMRLRMVGATLMVVLTACAVGDASSPGPTGPAALTATTQPSVTVTPTSSVPSAEPATEPASASPSPIEATNRGFAIFASAVNGLRLRAGPSLAAEPLSYRCTGNYIQLPADPADCTQPIAIEAGRPMVVFDGPVAKDGFDWYLVVLTGREPGADQLGWVATPLGGDAWLVRSELECPGLAPDVLTIAMERAMPAHCYQGRELTLDGWVVTGFGCNIDGTFEPTWLAHPCANMSYVRSTPTPSMGDQPLFLHYPAPGVTNPTLTYNDGQHVRIVGHYDDQASVQCVIEFADPARLDGRTFEANDSAADVAVCRMRFVVTEVTPLP